MQPFKTLTITEELAGKEWTGEYTICTLTAREYLSVGDGLIQELRLKDDWDGQVPENELRYRVVCKSVLKDGKPISPDSDMPSKLFELLSSIALPLNTLTLKEQQSLFLASSKAKQPRRE